ncbi:hypothetical protein CAFE_17560 [Caprobacter fermentans]|uniref:DNA primase/nucleoside triphosphatase C-terminal domain-containing protein n=1 Tax=Caproicibacter fermentans TaxID=2576756 RepID=A0A6N8HYX5_9FIRM|nr:primase-like DNA-binding domain-containing protein [Caproicibacter fermentans]MVB11054.1 hypothetical protein [Caproicibacter fermentans]
MTEKLDMEKLQKLVYYVNNAKMSGPQREQINRAVIVGILHGEIDTDMIFRIEDVQETSVSRFLDSDFLAERCLANDWIQATELYELYNRWCDANGIKPESLTTFGRNLKDMDVSFKKKADGNYYRLDSEPDQASALS